MSNLKIKSFKIQSKEKRKYYNLASENQQNILDLQEEHIKTLEALLKLKKENNVLRLENENLLAENNKLRQNPLFTL